jgi:hypothetical protein
MDIRSIEGLDDEWDRFVWSSPAGTIFHTLRFLSYHPSSRFDFVNLAAREDGRLVCVLPGGKASAGSQTLYRSPLGASFGGFVFSEDCGLDAMHGVIDETARSVRDMGLDGIDLVLAPECYDRTGQRDLRFLLTAAGYRLTLREATSVVPLASVDEAALHPVLARNLRKSERAGVGVRVAQGFEGFYDVLVGNLSAKNIAPTHTLGELNTLGQLFPDRLVLLEATHEQRIVGGCLLILCSQRVALAFYICDDPDARQLRVTEKVLWESIQWLKGEDYEYLDLGTVSRGGELDRGLARFKSKFGSQIYFRESYSLRFEEMRH